MIEKRVTIVINSLRNGGAERVCVTLVNLLVNRNWSVDLLVLDMDNAILADMINEKVNLINLNTKRASRSFFALFCYLKKSKPKILFVFNHQIAVVLIAVRKLFNFNFNIVARNINTLSQKKKVESSFWHGLFTHFLVAHFYKKVDRVIAQSHGMADDLVKHYRVERDQIVVINNPLRPVFFDSISFPSIGNACKYTYLLCVGKLEPQKALDVAILAFSRIKIQHPELRLKIIGTGKEESFLKRYAKELGVSSSIDFIGFVENTPEYFINAKATILSSRYEGFPNVIVESLSQGTPVVAYDCPSGPSEILQNGFNGILVTNQDFSALVSSIDLALKSKWDRNAIALAARKMYSPERIVDKYEKVICEEIVND